MKTHFQFEAVCGQKFTSFWYSVGDPLWFATHLPAYVCLVSLRRCRSLKLPLSSVVGPKRWFLGPRFVG